MDDIINLEKKQLQKINFDLSEVRLVATPPKTQQVEVSPSTSKQVVKPDLGKYIDEVTVNAVTAEIDPNIKDYNIRKGKTILGVEGTLESDKPDQTKEVIPSKEEQVVKADAGYELTEAIVKPIPDEYIIPKDTIEITTNGTHDVTNYASANVNVPSSDIDITGTWTMKTPQDFNTYMVFEKDGVVNLYSDVLLGESNPANYRLDGNKVILITSDGESVAYYNSSTGGISLTEGGEDFWVRLIPEGILEITENGRGYDVFPYTTVITNIQGKEDLTTELDTLDTALDDLETFVDGMEESGGGTTSGLPIELSTDEEMASVLTDENIGKVYKFVGTSEIYKTNKIYIIKEA